MPDSEILVENQILQALSPKSYQNLLPHLQEVDLSSEQVVHKSQEVIAEIYFPQSAIFSSAVEMRDGSTIEVSLIGSEGIVGLSAIFGDRDTAASSIVQLSGKALKVATGIVRQEFYQAGEFQSIALLYTQAYIAHVSHISACNSLHTVEQRLARFLLLVQDACGRETLPLTQKLISSRLGVRRASITDTAISLQSRKIIQYRRGKITILNRLKLEAIACECYAKIKSNYRALAKSKPS